MRHLKQTAVMADAEPPPFYEPPTPFAEQRSDLRAGIGRRIGQTSRSAPAPVASLLGIGTAPALLQRQLPYSPDTCGAMCEQIDAGSYPSPLYEKEKHEDVRTSYSCNLDAR